MTLKGIAIGALLLLCLIGSGIAETSRIQVMEATSVEATMAQMGVHE